MSRQLHHESFFRIQTALKTCVNESAQAIGEQELLQSLCNILVRSVLFQVAWFGYADESGQRVTIPVAWVGGDDGFVETLRFALNQDGYDDPASVCIRTGDACWIKELANYPGLGPMRLAVLRGGYQSVIAVPLMSEGKAYGALSLYFEDPETFGEGILELLKEKLAHVQTAFAERRLAAASGSEKLQVELQNLIDVLPITVGLCDADGMWLHLNRRMIDYSGYSVEDHVYRDAPLKYIHPDDYQKVDLAVATGYPNRLPFEYEVRHLGRDNQYRWFLVHVTPIRNESGAIARWCHTGTDIEEQKKSEDRLRQSEADLLEAQKISHTGSWKHDLASDIVTITPEIARIFGAGEESRSMTAEFFFSRLHPEDRPPEADSYRHALLTKTGFESDYRILLPDGSIRHVHNIGRPKLNDAGDLAEFVGTVMDVTAAKQAEEKIRQSEREARQILDLSPLHITLFGPGGDRVHNNRAALEYYGLTLERWQNIDTQELVHPEEAKLGLIEIPAKFRDGFPFDVELRLRKADGQHRWFHYHFSPMLDERGTITRWYAAGTDIDDRKTAEERLQEENVSLREEVNKASMFEEIVGTSASVKKVISLISKVAPTDSSVLITGETGTGKELAARAIHRRSTRCSRPFVSVNCAAIPRDLIASELFGHEKGAFTGATQRRLGRFELATRGTIFLDEVGELPCETQVALLRVLQEHEFERIGGTSSIQTDVRVIAATNRDLETAIAAGTFRNDLFYRLNVFPLKMPPLRERIEDIPLLVEYFLDRYARKAGKHFRSVENRSLKLLQSYPWPGNIRELQNVMERSVIVSETDTFSVDESWLAPHAHIGESKNQMELSQKLAFQEKEIIEAALRECGGRVSGRSGAAARLGVPGSTLESKIRSLKINKHRFKA